MIRRRMLSMLTGTLIMRGVGGTPPAPAGFVPPTLPGQAPGSSSKVVRARLVIVSGPSGTVEGVFLYPPGTTPGPGNPPIAVMTTATTDPYGNAVVPQISVGLSTSTQLSLQASGSRGILNFLLNNASFTPGRLQSVISGAFAQNSFSGPQNTVAGFTDFLVLTLNSSDAISSSANANLIYQDANGTQHNYEIMDFTGVKISACSSLKATAPGTGTSATNPAASETWHDLRPLLNSFVGTNAGKYPPQVQLDARGFVNIFGVVKLPASYGSVTWQTLPAAYRPNSNPMDFPIAIESNGTSNLVTTPLLQIDTGGNMQFKNMPTGLSGAFVDICVSFPLDSTGLITS